VQLAIVTDLEVHDFPLLVDRPRGVHTSVVAAPVRAPERVGAKTDSAANRPAAPVLISAFDAAITGTSPPSRHRISPAPSKYLSYPSTGTPMNWAVAAQMNPAPGANSCVAVKVRQVLPRRM
jgi:hypothetical protein